MLKYSSYRRVPGLVDEWILDVEHDDVSVGFFYLDTEILLDSFYVQTQEPRTKKLLIKIESQYLRFFN